MGDFWTGLLLVFLAGLMGGSFTLPQKFIRGWSWEKSWLLYAVVGMILVPWCIVTATIPQPLAVYSSVPASTLALTALFGAGWGVGSVLFGLGVARVGTALAFAIVVSLTAALGTLVPLLVRDPKRAMSPGGSLLFLGLAIVIVGLVLCARAGRLKELQFRKSADPAGPSRGAFAGGLAICIVGGITSPMFNFGLFFGKPIQDRAETLSAPPATASSAVLAVVISAGFLVNAAYCLYLLGRNGSWSSSKERAGPGNYACVVAMGLLWMFGMFAFGLGSTRLGEWGLVLGWPLFMTAMVLVANVWGLITGEWHHAGRRAVQCLQLGNAAMVLAFVVIAQGARLANASPDEKPPPSEASLRRDGGLPGPQRTGPSPAASVR